MHITIERQSLLRGIERVRSVVEGRNTIPVLSNLKLEVTEGELVITATDLDIEAVARCPAPSLVSGSAGDTTVPAATLYDIVRKLPDGAQVILTLPADDPRLQVKAGRSAFKLPVLPSRDFPSLSADGLPPPVVMPSAVLARLLDKVAFAMSSEEVRYYLNGAFLTVAEGRLRAVSTDGHRLALVETDLPAGLIGMPSVILPRKLVRELRKLCDGCDVIEVQVGATKVRFGDASARLTSKVIDGSFPDYMRVIPRDNAQIATIDSDALAKAVDRVATVSQEKSRSAKMEFADGRLTISVRNMEAGQGVEELEAGYQGPDISVGLNARYLLDVLARCDGDDVELCMADAMSPVLIRDRGDADVKFVVMPLRT